MLFSAGGLQPAIIKIIITTVTYCQRGEIMGTYLSHGRLCSQPSPCIL